MNFLGYLVTWANLQNLGGPHSAVKTLSIRVAGVQSLAQQIRSLPEYSLESFKETGYSRVGNVGKYISKNVQEFLNNGNVNPKDDGLILTFYYKTEPSGTTREPISFFIEGSSPDDDVSRKIHVYLEKIKEENGSKRYIIPVAELNQ